MPGVGAELRYEGLSGKFADVPGKRVELRCGGLSAEFADVPGVGAELSEGLSRTTMAPRTIMTSSPISRLLDNSVRKFFKSICCSLVRSLAMKTFRFEFGGRKVFNFEAFLRISTLYENEESFTINGLGRVGELLALP